MDGKSLSRFIKKSVCLGLSALLMIPACPLPGHATETVGMANETQILKGDVLAIPTKALTRISVTDPLIVDITDAKPEQVTLIGKEPGQTVVFIWDETGKRTIVVRVVAEDLSLVRARIQALLESAGISGVTVRENVYEGKVVLVGDVPDEKIETLQKVIDPFADKVINFVKKEEVVDLIQIDMQVTELATTLTKELGVDWSTGGVGTALTPGWQETLPPQTGELRDLFKIGDFARTNALLATVNALIKEGKARILSKPRLVVMNGKEATLLVGGEIPIKSITTNSSGGTSTQNTEFKEYGVSMAITPTLKDGKVDVVLNVQISDIDSSKPTGNDVAFLTRSAQTQLLLDDKQTIVLAGLIKKRTSEVVSKVPLLGSIPVLGALFRSRKTPVGNEDTEVVISLTPTVIRTSKKVEATALSKMSTYVVPVVETRSVEPAFSEEPLWADKDGRNDEELPVITKNIATVPVTVPENLRPYALAVQQKISSAIAYPYEAQQNGWQGTVKLGLVIKQDGTLSDVYVKESSGYDVFDQDALNTAQILAPYAPFPENMREGEIAIALPIVYSLDSFLKNVAKRN